MTIVTLPNNYLVSIDRMGNYTLYKTEEVYDEKKDCMKEKDRRIGCFSSFDSALLYGYIKDMEAIGIDPDRLTIYEYISKLEQIEKKFVSDFNEVLKVQLCDEEFYKVVSNRTEK